MTSIATIENDEDLIDFFKLEQDIDKYLDRIWYNVFVPYLNLENDHTILNLDERDIESFKNFFYENSKYYNFVVNNLYN